MGPVQIYTPLYVGIVCVHVRFAPDEMDIDGIFRDVKIPTSCAGAPKYPGNICTNCHTVLLVNAPPSGGRHLICRSPHGSYTGPGVTTAC